jgi:hypothetical protein
MQSLEELQNVTRMRNDMIANNDVAGLRLLFRFGCAFALHSVNERVALHEEHFVQWTADGETHHKRFFGVTHDGLEGVDRLCATMTVADWQVSDWAFAAWIEKNVKGLRYAKASFAAACMGFNCPCVDILALRIGLGLSKEDAEAHRDAWRSWADYFRDCFILFDMQRDAQWRMYADWQADYAASGHSVYFDAVYRALDGALVVPPTPPVDPVARAAAKARKDAKRAATKARKDAERAAA